MTERPLLHTVALMAATTAWGAAVSVREDVVGEPLRWRARGSVRTHLAVGWGSGLSAPWPMVALAFADAVRERAGVRAGRWIERSPLVASALVANVTAAVLMIRAGRKAQPRRPGGPAASGRHRVTAAHRPRGTTQQAPRRR